MALVKLLLDRGADTDTMDDFQNTPLKLAQETGIRKWLKFFQTPRAWRQQFRRILRIDTKRLILKSSMQVKLIGQMGCCAPKELEALPLGFLTKKEHPSWRKKQP